MNVRTVAVVGGGFTGLAAAYELGRQGVRAVVLEADREVGGLAGSFDVDGVPLEKFYHHWFRSDRHVLDLIDELGASDRVLERPTRTGMYFNRRFYRLSTPLDVLRFDALPWIDRVRLGLLVLRARRVRDWRTLEDRTAADWLRGLAGERVYRVVWEPLLRGKFGPYAERVSAVWFWNKLVLRGGSRDGSGEERLAYFRGGFAELARLVSARIEEGGGEVRTGTPVDRVVVGDGRVVGVRAGGTTVDADAVLLTTALPIAADLVDGAVDPDWTRRLRSIEYLANVCLVLQLDRSLSSTYWLNVNDPSFPYVGVIEHTNFEPPSTYGGRHVVYLSRYLPVDDPVWGMDDDALLDYSVPHIRRMFPEFRREWIRRHHVWKARWAQPVVERRYRERIPPHEAPLDGLWLASMAQIHPEDRGTNYAVRDGRDVARRIASRLQRSSAAASSRGSQTTQGAGRPSAIAGR